MTDAPRIAAIVLAAGLATRMRGVDKLLALWQGRPLIEHAVQALPRHQLAQVLVVTGRNETALRAALAGQQIDFVANPDPAAGMGSSIACGAREIGGGIEAVLICLGDMPAVKPASIETLLAQFRPGRICVPVYRGRRGHPVLFAAAYLSALASLTGDQGGREILTAAAASVHEITIDDPGILLDVDTPDMLAMLTATGG